MKNIFWTIRYQRLDSNLDLWQINLNWNYTPSFFLNSTFSDRIEQNIISPIYDMVIPEWNYTWKIPKFDDNWNPTWELFPILDRFFYIKYNNKINPAFWITEEKIKNSIIQIWNQFAIYINTIDEIKVFIKNFTNLKEISDWKFLLSTDPITGENKYLNIVEEWEIFTNS
mgnify:CR=1 FL=1